MKSMKTTIAIVLGIFAIIVTSVLTAGLVTYQNKKDMQSGMQTQDVSTAGTTSLSSIVASSSSSAGSSMVALNASLVAKHSVRADCWMTINNKVYNITNFFGQHPGGDQRLLEYCGKDATTAFEAQGHSAFAHQLLADFFVGNIGASVTSDVSSQAAAKSQSSSVVPKPTGQNEIEDD